MSTFDSRVNSLVAEILDRQESYKVETEEYRERGHRNQFCFHGVNMWVDYDCACAWCEDGAINEYSSLEEIQKCAEEEIQSAIDNEVSQSWKEKEFIEMSMKEHHLDREQAAEIYALMYK